MNYDPLKHGVTQSILSTWLKCRRCSELALEGWTQQRPSGALQFGELAHGVLEDVYSNNIKTKKIPDPKLIKSFIDKRISDWKKDKGQTASAEALQQLEHHHAVLEIILPEYFKHWEKQDFKLTTWKALEEEFEIIIEVPVGLDKVIYKIPIRGKMDGVYYVKNDLNLFETKTKGRIDEGTIRELLMVDFQTMVYSWALWKKYGKIPKAVRYNIIRRPGNKLKKNEDYPTFIKRLTAEIKADPKHYFVRYRIDITEKDVKNFEAEFKQILEEFMLWRIGKLPTYKNHVACVDRYGTCGMLPICAYKNFTGFYKRTQVFQELENKKEEN